MKRGRARSQGDVDDGLPVARLPRRRQGEQAVRAQKEELPYDSRDPLFPFGHGLRYENA